MRWEEPLGFRRAVDRAATRSATRSNTGVVCVVAARTAAWARRRELEGCAGKEDTLCPLAATPCGCCGARETVRGGVCDGALGRPPIKRRGRRRPRGHPSRPRTARRTARTAPP